jgi:ABC-type bacteriocin/lantibiotic exporter with double-glycine peptidase domain
MDKKLSRHLKNLKLFNNQRKAWLVLSAFVVLVIGKIVFDKTILENHHYVWAMVAVGLTISVVWWYWTMRLIRQLIDHRQQESEILVDIVNSIKDIKEDVKNLPK